MLILWIICGFLFSPNIYVTTVNGEDQEIWVERGRTVDLKCPIKTETCGELHAVTWFKNEERVAVVSGTGDKKRVETAFQDRFLVDYKSDKKQSYLTLKFAEISDENVYKCDRTYLTPSEKCEIAAYSFQLKVYVEPEQTQVTDEAGKVLQNDTRLGPFREGDSLRLLCEARGARPVPKVNWYRSNQLIQTRIVPAEKNGLFTIKSELPLRMSREDIGTGAECRIETPGGKPPKVFKLRFDVQVRPTKISLSSLKKTKKFVEGETAVFKCEVSGARPGANITWYNDSTPFLPDQAYPRIDTNMVETVNGTFTTTSFLTFNATMFDNGTPMRCEADNKLMREKGEKPMRDKYDIDVLYPPVINSTPNVYILVNESNEAVLKCNFLSNPASLTKVRWLKDGQELNLNQSRFEGGNKENPALNIKITKPGDSGSYVCELTNDIGTTTAKYPITVDVQFPPVVYLSMEPESPLIESAEANVTLNCSVLTGNPPTLTKVRWFLEGALLKELPECNVNQTDDSEDLCNIDPSKLLLQNVGRDFLGNYSCEGYNDVGWGPRSNELNLVVYYPPGNATLTHYPLIPKIKDKVTFKCTVNVHGLPEKHKYRFFRDGIAVKDSDSSEYIVEANIFNRANFSCLAFNEGGDGNQGFDELEVHVPPTFVHALEQYTGIHYKGENASLTCKVQCYPRCNIMWFKDSEGISEADNLYNITEEYRPPNHSTGDFETVVSTLHFNMPAWPGGVLDKHKDNAHYSCSSTDTSAGNGVRGSTFVSIEYAPFNVTVSPAEFEVEEGNLPPRISCNATAKPEPKFEWKFNDEAIFSGATLILNQAVQRTNNGQYTCYAHNKHGNSTASTKMNVLYKPTCDVVRQQKDEEDTLICTGSGNPSEISYSWTMKTENETVEIMTAKKVGQSSHLPLKEDFTSTREYYCIPNNTVGSGQFCKIEVAAVRPKRHSPWYKRWDSQTILIVVGIVLGLLLAAIIICVIICCVCRRRRRQNKLHGKSSALGDPLTEPGEYENLPFHGLQTAPNKFATTPINFNNTNVVRVAPHPKLTSKPEQQQIQQKYPVQHNNNPSLKQIHYQQQPPFTTTSSTSSQKLLSSSSNSTVHNNNGGESGGSGSCNTTNYAIPNKSIITNTTNYDLGNCFPTSYTAYYHYQQQQQCTTTNPPHTGNTFINNYPYTVENNIVTSGNTVPFNNPFSASNFKKFNTNTACSQGLHRKKADSDKKFYSLKSLSNKKGLHFCSMKQSLASTATGGSGSSSSSSKCKRHHSLGGGNSSGVSKTLPLSAQNRNKLNFYEPPLYENLTDSIQIRESNATPGKSDSRMQQQIDDFNNLIEPEHSTIYRSDSGISNSSYDCATPVPTQRQGGPQQHHHSDKYSMNPVYMNVAGNTSSTSTTTTSSLAIPLSTTVKNNNTFEGKSMDGYVPMTNTKTPKSNNEGLDKGWVNPSSSSSNNNPTNIHKEKHHHRHHHSKQSSGNRKCKKRTQNSTTLANNECGRDTNPFLASTSSSLSNFSGNSQGSMETSTTSSSSTSNRIVDIKQNSQTLVPKDLYAYNLPSSSTSTSVGAATSVHCQQQQHLKLQQHQKMPIQPSSTIKTGTPSQIKNYNKSKCDSKYTLPIATNYNSDTSLSNINLRHQKPNSYSRPMKLPLRKHHSFHFQPPQTVPFKSKSNFKNNVGPLIYKPFTNNDVAGFKPIPNNSNNIICNRIVSNSIDNSNILNTPRICGTVLKRHMSNVESYDCHRYIRTHSLSSPRLNTCVTDEEEDHTSLSNEDEIIDEIIITQTADDNQSSSSNSTIVNQDIRLVYADLEPITNNKNRSNRDHSRNMLLTTSNAKVINSIDDFDDLTINSDGEQFRRNGTKLRQNPYCGGIDARRIANLGDDMTTVVATPLKPKTQYASLKYNEVNI